MAMVIRNPSEIRKFISGLTAFVENSLSIKGKLMAYGMNVFVDGYWYRLSNIRNLIADTIALNIIWKP